MAESAPAFEAALQDIRIGKNGEEQPITEIHVVKALEALAATVFPHRAREIQKLWMNHWMYKPAEFLTTRQMAVAINRLNNALPMH